MEQQSSNERDLFNLEVDFDSGGKLIEAARWAKFIAIVIFVGIGLVLLALVMSGPGGLEKAMQEAMLPYAGQGVQIYYGVLFIMAFYVYVTILLFRFANLTRQGVQTHNQATFNEGLRHLKRYFLIHGVFALLGIIYNLINTLRAII